ncbi:MAG TPA: DUF4097 family beta strand repeat-containing protein [Candidatus Dormibacteraeota bacterium]|nr:DUF4097 family beta strand repeat-containing protein [Candidatus Dormibacteraeota bacterium]
MSPELSDVVERRFKVTGGAVLRVENPSGETRVRGADGDEVVVRARKRTYADSTEGGKRVLENLEIQMEQNGNEIRIWQRAYMLERGWMNLFRERRAAVDYLIEVPRGSQVSVRSASGEIVVRAIEGALELQSVSGDVLIEEVRGPMRLKTVSGDVSCVRCGGVVDANTVSGDLVFRSCTWPSGHVRSISGDLVGEVRLGDGQFELTTISGDVQLVTPSPFSLRFETTSGDLHSSGIPVEKLGRRSYAAHVGTPGADITVHTVSGDVAIRPGDVDAPDAPAVSGTEDATRPPAKDRKTEALEILHAVADGSIDADEAARRLDRVRR